MIDLVVPTIGRRSLAVLLASLAASSGTRPRRIFLVDDRRDASLPLDLGAIDDDLRARIEIVRGDAAGPAAARNRGWRRARTPWIAFLDDDVVVSPTWLADLDADLRAAAPDVAGVQGRVHVPLPDDRRPTDRERNVAGLATGVWITADLAYRRGDLLAVGGFDERFPRAYREDADLGLRITARGRRIVTGTRRITHPVHPASWDVTIRQQAGNGDDVLMRALHGPAWRERAQAPRGAFRDHAITVASAAVAALGAGVWAARTARFAWRRIAPGPRTPAEVATMVATSAAIPFAAVRAHLRARWRLRALLADTRAPRPLPAAVLFDRDGTLVDDVPYNGDPERVVPVAGAREALDRLRAAAIPVGLVSNQSGVALGKIAASDVDACNARLAELVGELDTISVCVHGPDDGCACRKPAPGLIVAAARDLGVDPRDVVVIGDIGADVDAAHAAGARAILVPTAVTRPDEVAAAPVVARDLAHAVDLAMGSAS